MDNEGKVAVMDGNLILNMCLLIIQPIALILVLTSDVEGKLLMGNLNALTMAGSSLQKANASKFPTQMLPSHRL